MVTFLDVITLMTRLLTEMWMDMVLIIIALFIVMFMFTMAALKRFKNISENMEDKKLLTQITGNIFLSMLTITQMLQLPSSKV